MGTGQNKATTSSIGKKLGPRFVFMELQSGSWSGAPPPAGFIGLFAIRPSGSVGEKSLYLLRNILVLLVLAVSVAVAAASRARAADGAAVALSTPENGGAAFRWDDSTPVPVPEPSEKALRFYRSGNVLWCVRVFWELLVPALALFTGLSARIQARAERIGRKWLFVVVIYLVTFTVTKYLVDFPLNWYQGFVRLHAYDLSNQSFGRWLGNSLKRLGVETAVGAAFLWVPYLLIRISPRRWWLYVWMAAAIATVFVVFITPLWIDPLFNRFGPIKDKELEGAILELADRAGIEGGRVCQVDKSVDTKAVNAYVTGLLKTKRIVLWDTLIAKLDRRELLTVMGHEMGHYVLRHVWEAIVLSSVLTFCALYALFRLGGPLIDRFKERFGFHHLSDIASWPLVVLIFAAGQLALDPFILAFSRHLEHEADRFGLEITRDNHAAATAEVKLQLENLGVPRPGLLYTLWRASHPSAGERIDFADTYKPWEKGGRLTYEHLIKPRQTNAPARSVGR